MDAVERQRPRGHRLRATGAQSAWDALEAHRERHPKFDPLDDILGPLGAAHVGARCDELEWRKPGDTYLVARAVGRQDRRIEAYVAVAGPHRADQGASQASRGVFLCPPYKDLRQTCDGKGT